MDGVSKCEARDLRAFSKVDSGRRTSHGGLAGSQSIGSLCSGPQDPPMLPRLPQTKAEQRVPSVFQTAAEIGPSTIQGNYEGIAYNTRPKMTTADLHSVQALSKLVIWSPPESS